MNINSKSKISNLTNNQFKNLIDIIHNKLFGKKSNIIIYFKSQGNILFENENFKNKKYKNQGGMELIDSGNNKNLENNYNHEEFDNIIIEEEKNANDTALITVNESNSNLLDMSLRDKKYNNYEDDDESETVSKYSDTSSQNINIPENDDDANFSKFDSQSIKSKDKSFADDYLSNIKI